MVFSSSRTRLLLILVLCAFSCIAVGDVTRDEVIAFKKLRGSSNSQALHEVLEVDEQEVGPSRRHVEGASDLDLNKHPDHSEFYPVADPGDAEKAPPAHGGACDHEPVIGNLAPTGGEDGHHDYTLTVQNVGKSKLDVTIQSSNGWKATPGELALSKGQKKSVTVSMTDNEAARHIAKLNISWSYGDCYVYVPAQNIPAQNIPAQSIPAQNIPAQNIPAQNIPAQNIPAQNVPAQNVPVNVDHSSYSTFLNAPGTAALLLGGSLVFLVVLGVAGIWGCISWRAHARRHGDAETKYQELEMAATDPKQGEEEGSPSADGWEEGWEDDDWQDTEAGRTSSSALTLSSAGLNSRRANKDGWDSSWDD